MPFFSFKSKKREKPPPPNSPKEGEPSESPSSSATNPSRFNKQTAVRYSDLLAGRSFDSAQEETVTSSASSEPMTPPPPPQPPMTMFQRMKSFIKKGKDSKKGQSEYDPTQPLILSKCKSPRGLKCCNPNVTGMSREHLLQYIEHWETCLQEKQFEARGSSFNTTNYVKEVYTDEVINVLLTDCNFENVVGINNSRHECFVIVVMQAVMVCPPFVQFVAQKPANNKLDKLIRHFVGQYIAQSQLLTVSPILRELFPDANRDEEDDAEKFWEALASNYLNEDIAKISTTYRYICDCGFESVQTAKDNALVLTWPNNSRLGNEPTKVNEMVKTTAQKATIEKNCPQCERTVCILSTTHELSDIFVINVSPYYFNQLDSRRLNGGDGSQKMLRQSPVVFHSNEDFGALTLSQTPLIYKLKAIVYYHQNGKSSGHYWARVFHNEKSLYADDNVIRSVNSVEKPRGRPYFAVYTRKAPATDKLRNLICPPSSDAEDEANDFDGIQPGPSTRV